MRTTFTATITVVATAATLAVAAAPSPTGQLAGATIMPGVDSGAVTYVGTLPLDAGNGFGATVHENLLIVTGPRGLTVYDTTELVAGAPTPIGTLDPEGTLELAGAAFMEEPRTDGERLIVHDDLGKQLHLIDISDPTQPTLVHSHPTAGVGHLYACVLDDCSILYSSHGPILDITDMSAPVQIGDWTELADVQVEQERFHAIDEVAPGIVLTGTEPLYLLDARDDVAAPVVIASGRMDEPGMIQAQLELEGNNPRYYAARVEWPARTTPLAEEDVDLDALLPQHERWGIVSVETPLAADCDEGSGALLTYDFDRVEEDREFTVADDYRITGTGTYTDGLAPFHTTGCFAYGFSQHPRYTETRLVAVAWTEHGMRLVTIGEDDGHIDEVGWFVGVAGNAADAEWISDDTIAIVDLARGIDIVRVDMEDFGG